MPFVPKKIASAARNPFRGGFLRKLRQKSQIIGLFVGLSLSLFVVLAVEFRSPQKLMAATCPFADNDGNDNDAPLYIGAHPTSVNASFPDGANHGFRGGIDELRISNVYLAESQLMVVPEPASLALGAVGILIAALLIWLRH